MNQIGLFVIPIKVNNNVSTYNDYIDFLVEAEKFGYTHVYVGEHLTDSKEDIQSSLIFSAALLARTKNLNVCLCVLPLPHYDIKLLIKQLEDLFRLAHGRLQIGFSQGALKSDAEYLNFDHSSRSHIFNEKLNLFLKEIKKSSYLNKIPSENFFSTLLSPYPVKSSFLYENSFSAITSNFVNEHFWENHIGCFLKNNHELKSSSKWHISLNLRPKELITNRTKDSIKESLFYIYEKLKLCNIDVMLPEIDNKKCKYKDLLDHLYRHMTYEEFPKKYFFLKEKYKNIMGHPIVNLFDCIDDLEYTEFIMGLPKNENF